VAGVNGTLHSLLSCFLFYFQYLCLLCAVVASHAWLLAIKLVKLLCKCMPKFIMQCSHIKCTCPWYRCVGVETSLRVHNFVYTVQPVPIVGRVDLAAVFLDAVKFKQEQLYFSKLLQKIFRVLCHLTFSAPLQIHSIWTYIVGAFCIFEGNFSDVTKYACKGCQDGYLTESLVAQRHWSYYQLPIDGLKSMVFHGPSPTLCVASGA